MPRTAKFWTPSRRFIAALVALTVLVWVWKSRRVWATVFPQRPVEWRSLQAGLDYSKLDDFGVTIHAVRVDLRRFDLRLADARGPHRRNEQVAKLLEESQGLVAVNSSFFDLQTDAPLGWLVDQGRELHPFLIKTWYVTFVVLDSPDGPHAELLPNGTPPPPAASVRFGVQAGPATVWNHTDLVAR